MSKEYIHPVQVYYEDTDHSGVVFYANYLKYCARAREHILGHDALVDLFNEKGMGFAVYKVDMTFKEGAVFGDLLEVKTTIEKASDYRGIFKQDIWRKNSEKLLVSSVIELVCLSNDEKKMVPLPRDIIDLVL
jgi:tol-pal system-associated acyl-CoA thioesterase